MPLPLIAGLPAGLQLPDGFVVRVNALDPATSAQVTGVTVTNFSLYVTNLVGTDEADLEQGPWYVVPGPSN